MVTDVDYKVALDSTLYDSPYERHTYRYSPLLSFVMSPSYKIHQTFGKYIIAFIDIIAAFFTYKMYLNNKKKMAGLAAVISSYMNPFMIYISTRGSF